MIIRFVVIAALFLLATNTITVTRAAATELLINGRSGAVSYAKLVIHRYARVWPQDCFLMPDVIVAINALGPYCSSPRVYYHHDRRY
jgi:hypothetical protein